MITAINLTAIMMSAIALITAIAALAMVIGLKLSTHKVEWKSLDFDKYEEDATVKVEEDDTEFLEKTLNLQRKKKKEVDPLDALAETSNF